MVEYYLTSNKKTPFFCTMKVEMLSDSDVFYAIHILFVVFVMNFSRLHIIISLAIFLMVGSAYAQDHNDQKTQQALVKNDALLENFSRKCERRTRKAERRFDRYERKMTKSDQTADDSKPDPQNSKPETEKGLGKESLLDSLRLIYGFADHTGLTGNQQGSAESRTPSPSGEGRGEVLSRAQQQLNITQRTKSELLGRKEYWKAQVKEHPEYGKWLTKMEKERYYYTAQINEYRKTLRDPSALDEKLMSALRRDPRFSDFIATLPAKPQNPEKMQPRQLVQQMMKSQAAAIDPDPAQLLREAKSKGKDVLGDLSNQATSFGNMDNAAQMPKFTPNPYKTKSFWQRIDVGFNLQFDGRTRFLPSTGVAGAQASFNFDPKFSVGVLANYRFGMGEIKNIHFSHIGAGYGAFVNYKIWKSLGVQVGYERNWRDKRSNLQPETQNPKPETSWTTSALAGLTWEYGIGRKARGTVGVFFDALYKQHTPETNAVIWRMGWKM